MQKLQNSEETFTATRYVSFYKFTNVSMDWLKHNNVALFKGFVALRYSLTQIWKFKMFDSGVRGKKHQNSWTSDQND